jgi:hypothetical protein
MPCPGPSSLKTKLPSRDVTAQTSLTLLMSMLASLDIIITGKYFPPRVHSGEDASALLMPDAITTDKAISLGQT